jgi:hypothetical protein
VRTPRPLRGRLLGVVSGAAAAVMAATTALAASPTPPVVGGDPRSSGQGPGLVGDPAYALLLVVAIGVGALVLTLAYIRLTRDRKG